MGFVAKEVWLHALGSNTALTVATVIGGIAYVFVGLSVGLKPFIGAVPRSYECMKAPILMSIGPILLGIGSILMAFFCGFIGSNLVSPAAMAVYGKILFSRTAALGEF